MKIFKKLTSICLMAMTLSLMSCTEGSMFESNLGKKLGENFSQAKMNFGNVDLKKAYRCSDDTRPRWPDPCRFWK